MAPQELKVLEILHTLLPDKSGTVSFLQISKETALSCEELDAVLRQLENSRYIDQYVLGGEDNFKLRLLK